MAMMKPVADLIVVAGLVHRSVHHHSDCDRLLSRTRPLSRGSLVRGEDRRLLARLRPGTVRPGRLARHALAARGASARRLREISRRRQRRERRQRLGVRRRRSQPHARRPAALEPRGDRRGGPVANFILAMVIFTGLFWLSAGSSTWPASAGSSRTGPRRRPASRPAISSSRSTASRSTASRRCRSRRCSAPACR